MKRLRSSLKSSAALTLAFMLILSIMSGVLTLSASADEVLYPVIKNDPVMLYREPVTLDFGSDYYNDFYKSGYAGMQQTICLLIDDAQSQRKVSDIDHITYTYSDPEGVTFDSPSMRYYFAEKFNTLLISTDTYNPADGNGFYLAEKLLNKSGNYTYGDYLDLFESFQHSQVTVHVYYTSDPDEEPQSVSVKLEQDINAVTGSGSSYQNSTSGALVMYYLADGSTIDDEDFDELENAIVKYESSLKRFYVDVDSDKNIVLPMDGMSKRLTLEQTRVGGNIVYNTENSVDFGEYSVPDMSDGEKNHALWYRTANGKSFTRNTAKTAELNTYLYNSGYRFYMDDGRIQAIKSYGSNSSSDMRFIDNNLELINGNFYTAITGTDEDRQFVENQRKGQPPQVMYISLKEMPDVEQQEYYDFVKAFKEFYDSPDTSDYIRKMLKSLTVYYKNQNNANFNPSIRFDYTYSYYDGMAYNDFIAILENNGYTYYNSRMYNSNTGEYEYSNPTFVDWTNNKITGFSLQISSSSVSVKELEEWKKIADFIVEYDNTHFDGQFVNARESYIPTYDNYTVDAYSRDVLKPEEYYDCNRTTVNVSINNNLSREAYTGDFISGVTEDKNDVITDTFNDNKVTFVPEELQNIETGVAYNIVNQVSIGAIDNRGDGYKFDSVTLNGHNSVGANYGSVYYLNGDYIVSANTAIDTDAKNIMRHTEYKYGELMFVSRPGSVENLNYDYSKLIVK